MGFAPRLCHHRAMHTQFNLNHLLRLVVVSCLLASVYGCASTGDKKASASSSEPVAEIDSAPAEVDETPIPTESLMPLLEAEFALRNREFERGLQLLLDQAVLLEDPELARRTLQLAEFLEDSEASLIAAKRLAKLDPNDPAAPATAMGLLIRRGDSAEAINYAREAKAAGARINAPALLQNFESLPPEEAQAVEAGIETLAADYPEDIDIAIARALMYQQQERLPEAADALEPVLDADPYDERGLVLWTQIELDAESKKPFSRMKAAVAANPENEQLRLQYARLLASEERFGDARVEFERLIEASPRNGDYLLSLALIETETGQTAAARKHLNALIGLGQRPDEAYYYLGRLEETEGNIDASVSAYARVGESREFFDAKRRAARQLIEAGRKVEFAGFFETQRTRASNQADRLYLLQAEILSEREANREAIAVYSEALKQFPSSLSLRYGRAIAYERSGQIDAMEQDMRTILEDDPDNATTLNALGYSLTNNTDRYEEAVALIERALELSPNDAAAQDSLGWVYFKMGRLEEARELLEAAYAQLPDPEVAAHLGETLWEMGLGDEARIIWNRVLSRDPNNAHVRETVDRLGVDF